MVKFGILRGDNDKRVAVSIANRLQVESISYDHSRVHAGKSYTASKIYNTVPSGGRAHLLIQTGSLNKPHLVFDITVGGDAEAFLYEGTTFSNAGTSVPSYNNNRGSGNVAESIITHTPTIADDGTLINSHYIPGGSGVFAVGGANGGPVRAGTEIILALNTAYLMRVVNTSSQAVDMSISIGFYEEA